MGEFFLGLGPEHARTFAAHGLTRGDIASYLFDHARMPARVLNRHFEERAWAEWMKLAAPDDLLPMTGAPRQHPGVRGGRPRQAQLADPVVGHDQERHPAGHRLRQTDDAQDPRAWASQHLPTRRRDRVQAPRVRSRRRPARSPGLRIAVLDNGKPNAAFVMTRLAESLAARAGADGQLVSKKGPRGESANAAIPCDPEIFERSSPRPTS